MPVKLLWWLLIAAIFIAMFIPEIRAILLYYFDM
jgi:hypothetical protein